MNNNFIYNSKGFYVGFMNNDSLFSRDGIYLGWIEGSIVWDKNGNFIGILTKIGNYNYILRNRFSIPPAARTARAIPSQLSLPNPPPNISSINLPVELSDAF